MGKLQDKLQIDGKLDEATARPLDRVRTLDQLLGNTGLSKYGTLDEAIYQSQLDEMNMADLHKEAISNSLVPNTNRQTLIKRLLHEFNKHAALFQEPPKVKNPPVGKDIMKILAEGR